MMDNSEQKTEEKKTLTSRKSNRILVGGLVFVSGILAAIRDMGNDPSGKGLSFWTITMIVGGLALLVWGIVEKFRTPHSDL